MNKWQDRETDSCVVTRIYRKSNSQKGIQTDREKDSEIYSKQIKNRHVIQYL